jgi:fibronectin-binding autotransporter adhesin
MKRRTKRSRTSSLLQLRASLLAATALSVLGNLAVAPAFAQSASWNGTTSSDWFDALNWTGALPSPTVDVIVNGGTHSPKITGGGSAGAGNLRVGDAATGALTIENGTLEAYNTAIGKDGGTGTITVDGASAVFRSLTPISVGGENGTGTLTIRNGGSVSSLQGVIGDGVGSTGTVTVDGPNSSWVTTGAGMVIGNYGEGHFTVSGGASVRNERAMLGLAPTGRGTLVVTGAGSSWTDSGDMYVGYQGGAGTLEVRAGGSVEIFNSLYVGYGGEGIASVSGADATLTAHGGVVVGGGRNGTFTVSNGATVNSGGGYIDAASGYQGIATVTGAGSTWTMGDQLIIALEGKGTLTVDDGGRLETTQISLGSRNGAEGTLTISNGGVVATNYVMMAEETGARASLRLESGGRLEAQQVQRYDGAGTVVFDGGILRLTNDQFAGLFSGFQTGDVTLAAGGGTIDTGTFQVHMDIGLVGPGGLTKIGTGTFHLWGANSYSGITLVSAGTLRARETNVLSAASTHDIASGATLRLDNNKNQVIGGLAGAGSVLLGNAQLTVGANDSSTLFSGVISGTGKLVKSGSGTLTLAGNNSYSGGTEIVTGTLSVSADANLGATSGGLTFNGGTLATTASFDTSRTVSLLQAGMLDVAVSTTLGLTGTVSGAGALIKTGAGSLTLSGNNGYSGGTELHSGSLSVSADANLGATSGGLTFNGGTLATTASFDTSRNVSLQQAGAFDVASGTTLGLTGAVSGIGDLRKTGSGTLRLDNTGNSYANTLVETGTLIGNARSVSGNVSNAGTVVFDQAADGTFAGTIAGLGGTSGAMVKQGAGNLTLTGTSSLGWSITAGGLTTAAERFSGNADIGTGASLTFDQTANASYGGQLTGGGRLIKAGSATLRLDNAGNSYADTHVQAGSLIGNAGSISGSISNAGTVVFDQATDATFAGTIAGLGGTSGSMVKQGTGNLTLTGISSLNWSITGGELTTAAGRFSGNADISTGASLTFRQNANASYGGQLTGAGRVFKAGFATLTLSGSNSYGGGTELLGGMLSVSADANLGAASGGLTFNGGMLATTASFDTSRSVSLQHTGVFDVVAGATLGLTGVVSGTGDLQKRGSGTLRLDNLSNSYGDTQVEAGTLIGNAHSISGDIRNIGTVVFDQATDGTFAGTLRGFDGTSGSMVKQGAGNLTLTGTSSLNWSITAGGLTTAAERFLGNAKIGTGASLTFDQSADASYGGALIGTGNFIKSGTGSLTLTSTNSYTGATTIMGGALIVNGAIDSSLGGVAVNSGGTLSGMGTIGGQVKVNSGGALSGFSGRTLTMASLDLSNGASVNVTLGVPSTTALFNVTGNLTLGGTLNVSGQGDFGAGVYRLIDYGGTLTNNGLAIGTTPGVTSASDFFVQTAVAGQVNLLNSSGQTLGFWDGSQIVANGTIDGGTGTWSATNTNWTNIDGTLNAPFHPNPTFAVFQGTAGTVTVDTSAGAIGVTGLQFVKTNYLIQGGEIALQGAGGSTTVRVGDGTAGGAGTSATIASVLTGASALVKDDLGTLILSGNNSYGDTQVKAGTLVGHARSISGNIGNAGTVVFEQATDGAFAGTIAGLDGTAGSMVKQGAGNLTLTGISSLDWSITAGGLITAADRFSGNASIGSGASLTFDQANNASYGGGLSGTGGFTKAGNGTLTLSGNNGYTGATTINGGALIVIGAIDSRSGGVAVNSGGTLSGTGTIAGVVTVNSSGTLAGAAGSTLTLGGLALSGGASVNVALGAPSNQALFNVTGNLTLGGTLNVTSQGGFGAGVYRLMDYGGTLTDNGLAIGTTPSGTSAGDFFVQTAVAGQVNLLNSSGQTLGFWDGSQTIANGRIDGGSGTWSVTNTNWTNADGSLNAPYHPNPTYAVFQGTAGTVTVDGSGGTIGVTGLQFVTDGYVIQGDAIALQGANGSTTVRVGDGTAAGAGMSATVASALTGASSLVKDDLGTLILSGSNSYSGGAVLRAGSLSVQADANLGAASGGLTFNGGVLATTGSFDTSRNISLQQAGRFDVAAGTTLGLAGLVSGTGDLRKTGAGTLRLDNTANSYGNTLVHAGTLIGNALSISGNIANAGTVVLDQAADGTFAGTISGLDDVSGTMIKRGGGNLTLTGTSSLDWTIAAGELITAAQRFSGNASIGAGASLTLDQSANASYGGVLSGAGGFVKTGAGSLTLTGNNSYTGATTINGGALVVNGAIDSRSGGVAVNNGATLSGTGTIAGAVTVNSGGTLAGATGSTLTLGNLTLGSGASVNVALGAPSNQALFNVIGNLTLDGTVNVADLGGFGQGVYRIFDYGGALTNNGLTVGTLPGSTTGEVQTSIAKQVNLVVSESGPTPTILFWNGTTTVPTGTVQGGSGSWGGATTNWTNASGTRAAAWNGVFAVFQGTPGTVTVDAAGVSVTGIQFAVDGYRLTGGAVTLNGAGGSTTVRVGDGTAAGAGFTAVVDSALVGDSRLVKDDLGTLVLTGANSYGGGTTIAAGTLQIGNGGTSGAILGDVTNNGLLRFARSDATIFGGAISGSGGVQVQSGAVTFTANNSYTGATTIAAGATLQLGNGGTTGMIAGDVANAGALIVNLSSTFTYGGAIGGGGTIRQIGSGFTSLTGDSSGFTGTTRVEAGVLSVNGKLGGTVTVVPGGQLQGSGTVSNVAVAGTVAPGNSIGTLNVGNITFQAGSIYQVEVNANGQSDRIVATGTATINGGSVQVLAGQGSYQPNTTYTILTAAGGRTGSFAGVTSNLAFLAPSLSYDPDNVYLTLTRNTVSFPSIGGTFNQRQAGAGVESLGQGNPIWNAVVQMDASTAQAAFNQLSGEVHASAKTALYEDSRLVRDGALSRLRSAFGGSVVAPSTAQVASVDEACGTEACQADPGTGITAWAQGFGSWGYTSTNGNAAGLSRSTGGMLVGVDAPLFEVARLGLFGGYSHTNFNVADRQSAGGSDNVHLGAYGGAQWGPIGLRAGLAYTWHNLSTSRSVAFPGFADSLRATYGAGTFQLFGEAGYRFEVGQASFEPFANIAWMSLSTKGFSETGGAAALTSSAVTSNVTTTTLGLRAGSAFTIAGMTGQARGTVGWQHAFTDTTPWATLQLTGGTPFTAAGVPIAQDAALLELGIDVRLSERASIGIGYTGQFAAGSQDQSVRGNFTFRF